MKMNNHLIILIPQKDYSEITTPPLSREEWTELNKENRGLFTQIPFSDMRFADEEDPMMANDIVTLQKQLMNESL